MKIGVISDIHSNIEKIGSNTFSSPDGFNQSGFITIDFLSCLKNCINSALFLGVIL